MELELDKQTPKFLLCLLMGQGKVSEALPLLLVGLMLPQVTTPVTSRPSFECLMKRHMQSRATTDREKGLPGTR